MSKRPIPAGKLREKSMSFPIEWLHNGSVVDRETSVETDKSTAIAKARANAQRVAALHPGHEPDSFRLRNAGGEEIGVFSLGDDR
jgi:hypothetical protein